VLAIYLTLNDFSVNLAIKKHPVMVWKFIFWRC